jgi:hypothetical protein
MPSFGGDIGVGVEERASMKRWSASRAQCDDFLDVPLLVGEIDRVSDFFAPALCARRVV